MLNNMTEEASNDHRLYAIIKSAVKEALKEHSEETSDQPNYTNSPQLQKEHFPTWLTIKQFVQKHPFATEANIRVLISHSQYNGFNIVFIHIGRKILINEEKALKWFKDPPKETKDTCYQMTDKKND